MKKSLLILLVLVVVGAMAFAEDVKATYSITGSATTTFGYDLNLSSSGFRTVNSITLGIVLVPTTTVSKGGEGVYGYIELKEFVFGLDGNAAFNADNSKGTMTAKIVAGPVYVKIYNHPSFSFNYADNISGSTDVNMMTLPDANGGVAVGFVSGTMLDVNVGIWTLLDYTNVAAVTAADAIDPIWPLTPGVGADDAVTGRVANTANDYGYGLGLTLAPIPMISVAAKAAMYPYVAAPFGAFGALLTLNVIENLLTVTVGADYFMYTAAGGASYLDALPALTLTLGEDSLTGSLYYSNVVTATTNSEMDAKVKFTEADGDKGYLPIAGGYVSFELDNLAPLAPEVMGWALDTKWNATFGAYAPYVQFQLDQDSVVQLSAGVVVTAIANTTITADYTSADLTGVVAADKGIITLAAKITY
jgi:hypothetical protein